MRFVFSLGVALALAACQHASAPATPPANKVPAPDYRAAAADELAFLAVDSDFVIGVDMGGLRRSQMWQVFKPKIDALSRELQKELGSCQDFMSTVDGMSIAIKMRARDQFSGVIVVRGADMARSLDCSIAAAKHKGSSVTVDRSVTLISNQSSPSMNAALVMVGGSTLVMQYDPIATHDTLTAVLAAGSPLRTSPAFMKMYDRRERGAAMWGMANGNSPAFAKMASSGIRPKAIDGTIVVTDRMVIHLRMMMGTPAEADTIAREVDKVKVMAANYVQRLDAMADGPLTQITVELTDAQIQSLLTGMGGVGP